MVLNEIGRIVEKYWLEIPKNYKIVELDYYVIMPNHLHGIVIINELSQRRDVACYVSTNNNFYSEISPKPNSLSSIIRSYKSSVTKHLREKGFKNFQWQPRFYDRIIRNEKELYNIRKYIQQNPLKWEFERNHIENIEIL